jgi:hypothetical protein
MTKPQLADSAAEPVDDLDAYVTSTKHRGMAPPARPIWEPAGRANAKSPSVTIPIEQDLIDVIVKPIAPDERHRDGNERKERELAALLDRLTPVQSLALERRIANGAAGDPLVAAFHRLVVERRVRLLAYLARRRTIAITMASHTSRR